MARDFIHDEKPDVVIDVVDASNLERNLYLTTERLELGLPLVVALLIAGLFAGCPVALAFILPQQTTADR